MEKISQITPHIMLSIPTGIIYGVKTASISGPPAPAIKAFPPNIPARIMSKLLMGNITIKIQKIQFTTLGQLSGFPDTWGTR